MITKIMKQTNGVQRLANHVAFTVIFFACVICPLEGRVCTRVRSETLVKEVKYPGECQQSFEANCGWFSFEKCIFNETVPCVKTRNMTLARYRIVEDCCPGYHRSSGGRCQRMGEWEAENETQMVTEKTETTSLPSNISDPSLYDLVTVGLNATDKGKGGKGDDSKEEKTDETYPQTGDKETVTFVSGDNDKVDSGSGESGSSSDHDDDDDNFFLGISHGAYAGIICGILFVACVALLTAVHYRKRRLQDKKKSSVPADQDAAQRQQMISMEKLDSPPTVST